MFYPTSENFMLGNVGFIAAQKIGDINSRALTRLADLQIDIATTSLEQSRQLSNVTNYEATKQYYDQYMKMSEQTTGVLLDSCNELITVFEDVLSIHQTKPVVVTGKAKVTKAITKTAKPVNKAAAKKSAKPSSAGKKNSVRRAPSKKKSK